MTLSTPLTCLMSVVKPAIKIVVVTIKVEVFHNAEKKHRLGDYDHSKKCAVELQVYD